MKSSQKFNILWVLLLVLVGGVYADQAEPEVLYYGVEQNGVLCGYSESKISEIQIDGAEAILVEEDIIVKLSALGADFDTKIKFLFYINPETGKFFYHEFEVDQGTMKIGSKVDIDGDLARITPKGLGKPKEVILPPDVLLENTQIFYHVMEDFVKNSLEEKRYKAFDIMEAAVHEVTYTKVGIEELELAGKAYEAIVLNVIDHATGVKVKWWIDTESGYGLKAILPTRTIFLTDSSIKNKIVKADMDENIFARVNVNISDIKAISYMKAKAILEPGGGWITTESLNVPGQKFEGTVEENLIDGVFEITHEKYDGVNAPPFPPDFSGDEAVNKYIEPEDFVESDDTVLINKARKLTEGATDSWGALKVLSKWVSTEIAGGVPGGGSARGSYDLRLAECGGHSRLLAAFCRAVGIPCRVVWGCMYAPNYGGSFGQHAWNEVYMGEAGWVPVDATIEEIDYADCGHIRLGVLSTKSIYLNFKKAEILDYHAGAVTMENAGSSVVPDNLKPYIGKYQGPRAEFEILVQNASLAVDIPGKMIFELKEPNENGEWIFKLTDAAGISFEKDESGQVVGMTLISKAKLPRKAETELAKENTEVPENYRPYLGAYSVPMQNIALTVIFHEGNLAVDDPNKGIVQLRGPDEEGKWIDQYDRNQVAFDLDETGLSSAMIFYSINQFPKIQTSDEN